MKFAKGLLDEINEGAKPPVAKVEQPDLPRPEPTFQIIRPLVEAAKPPDEPAKPAVVVEKDRLFETAQKTADSSRNYLKLFAIVVVFIAIAAAAVIYLTLPGVGDRIRVSRDLEDAVRSHFLDKEKRTATDITFYKCDKYYWAHTEVETRTDIPGNPLSRVSSYATKATPRDDGKWKITALPITSPDMDTPCR